MQLPRSYASGAFSNGIASDFGVVANPASLPTFAGNVGIFFRELVPMRAVRLGLGFIALFFATNLRPFKKSPFRWVDDLCVSLSSSSSGLYGGLRVSRYFAKFCEHVFLSFNKDHNRLDAAISLLVFPRRPLAIFREIPGIVIDAIKGMRWGRFWPHICGECIEGINPPIAHSDTPASVIRPLFVTGVKASSLHPLPRAVKWRRNLERHDFGSIVTAKYCHVR